MRLAQAMMIIALLCIACGSAGAAGARSGNLSQAPEGWWEPIGPWGGECFKINISPRDIDTVFATGPSGIHRSLNRGVDWFHVSTVEMEGVFLSLGFQPGNEDTILAGGTGTGVWRSTDMGDTWEPFSQGLPGGNEDPIDVVSIVFTPDGTPWLGTRHGDRHGFVYRFEAGRWVRTDNGLMLNPPVTQVGEDPAAVMDTIVDEDEEEEEERRKKKKKDDKKPIIRRGPVSNPNPHATLIASDAEGRMWAGVYGGGIFRLDGDYWELMTKGGEGGMKPTCIIPYPGQAKRFYFGTQDDWIWYTITDGQYWRRMKLMDTSKEGALPMVKWLEIDPINNKLLWMSVASYRPGVTFRLFEPIEGQEGGGIAVTENRGRQWYHLFHNSHGYFNQMTLEPGESVIDILGERAAHLWATYDGYAAILYSELGIRDLSRRFRGYHGEVIGSILRTDGGYLIVATGDGLNRPDEKWEWSYFDLSDRHHNIFCIAEDYTAPDRVLYAVGGFPEQNKLDRRGIFRTSVHAWYPLMWPPEARNGRRTQGIKPLEDAVQLLENTPCWSVYTFEFDADRLWVGTQVKGILFSEDGGDSWFDYNNGLPAGASVPSIVLDDNAKPLFCGLRDAQGQEWHGKEWMPHEGEGGSVWRFDRSDIVWKRIPGLDAAIFQLDWIEDERREDKGVLRAVTADGLWEWDSDMETWDDIGGGLPERVIPCIAFPEDNPDLIYAGTSENGVWVTVNGGRTWTELSDELFCRNIWRLQLDPDNPEHLWAATLGAGVFEFGGE